MNSAVPPYKLAYTLNGTNFNSDFFIYLDKNFSSSYQKSIRLYSKLNFITTYEDNIKIEKTYAEFNTDVLIAISKINQLSGGASIFVAIVSNSYISIAFMIAALLSGYTLCLINPADGPSRIKKKIDSLSSTAAVWVNKNASLFDTFLENVNLMSLSVSLKSVNKKPVIFSNFPKDKNFILVYTSGSTGYSKVVAQAESGVLSNVDALIEHHELYKHKVIATPLPIFHVNALEFSVFCSLFSGGRLVLFDKFNLELILKSIVEDGVQILSVVPSILNIFSKKRLNGGSTNIIKKIEYFVCAASALSTKLAKSIIELYAKPIIQGYGLSEATNFSVILPINLTKEKNTYWLTYYSHPSVGVALRGNEVFVLMPDNTLCTEGQEGEICLRGFNLMKCYLNTDPKNTFQNGYFRTGDLGYFHYDETRTPYFFISGRIKDVIKRNGETISLREIDDIIQEFKYENFDAIAVGFANDFTGEEIGIAINCSDFYLIESVFLKFLEIQLNDQIRPRVLCLVDETIRGASGKPLRWIFTNRFDSFKSTILSNKSFLKK